MTLEIYTLYPLAIVFFGVWIVGWISYLTAFINAKNKLHINRDLTKTCEKPLPGVSIIKPLVGIDQSHINNLESFFHLNYPHFELLFCINDAKDDTIILVKKLIEMYPHVDSKLFTGGFTVGVNPKINTMYPGFMAAKYQLIWISDSGVKTKEDTLYDMVLSMADDVGMVHQMPFACDNSCNSFPAILEKVYFGTDYARMYLSGDFFSINCVNGMSNLMRKNVIDEAGGISACGEYLAEDNSLAYLVTDHGWKLQLSSLPALQNRYTPDIISIHNRLIRWAKLRISIMPQMIIMEPFSGSIFLGIVGVWSMSFLFQCDPFTAFFCHMLLCLILDYLLLRIIQNGPLPFSKKMYIVAWLLMESCALLLHIRALLKANIKWNQRTFKVKWGGITEELNTKS